MKTFALCRPELHPLERDLETLSEFCGKAQTLMQLEPTWNSEKEIFARGLVAYAIELATAVGWLTTVKIGPGALTLMTALEATQETIEHVGNEMSDNDLRSVLRQPKGKIKVNKEKWRNIAARDFRKGVYNSLRPDCRHGGSIHWGWLKEAEGEGRNYEYSIKRQRIAVWGADAALVLILLALFGEAADELQEWNYDRFMGNVWREEDLAWETSTKEAHWNGPYRRIQPKSLLMEMPRVSEAIDEYEKVASIVFADWGESRSNDTEGPWSDKRFYAIKTALGLAESVYYLIRFRMYGAAFALARASWESAANAYYIWNEEPNTKLLQFLQEEDSYVDRPIPLPRHYQSWTHPIAMKWIQVTGNNKRVLAELAKGERVQGQRWEPTVRNAEHCSYVEAEITSLIRFAAMNLMFLKASYFHFTDTESRNEFEALLDRWKPNWPVFEAV